MTTTAPTASESPKKTPTLSSVSSKLTFAQQEEETLAYWNKIDAFKTSLKKSEGKPAFTFYDGPPFATGLPHYGHILAGTIKDVVTRYAHQTGHYVERRFGWDCHGIPIEFEIEKKHKIKTKEQIMEMGLKQYNQHCRDIVMTYAAEWEKTVTRLGRWIDFKNDYKTMNTSFMESVWWVFKQLHEKGLVYRGFKVMPYSTSCTTPLSNFEVNQDTYHQVTDLAITVGFELNPVAGEVNGEKVQLLAWTTTPWTLPSNLALCVNPELDYVKIRDKKTGSLRILAELRLDELYNKKKEAYEVLEKFKGTALKGRTYKPLFNYFTHMTSAFRVLTDNYVDATSGTGIVHIAPAFGQDDYRVCMEQGVIVKGGELPCPIDENGRFLDPVSEYKGKYYNECNEHICERLKASENLVVKASIVHKLPHCWRSGTPLIYKAIPSWFVAVEKFKDKLVENNKKTYWVPESIQEGRFNNWLENAIDWAVSRTRYWGTPLPVWKSDDFEEIVVVGSVEELEQLTGVKGITDLHRDNIDHLQIPSKQGKGMLKRVEDVFDCWFESGSMPYAQVHYPFENQEKFKNGFPADFIAEGLDQTRGWFYTLLVLSTALFDQPPFKNLIVNGIVLNKKGEKMSKSKRNFEAPEAVIDKSGADALRLYLINSPLVKAEALKFNEDDVAGVAGDVLRLWLNAYRFFVQQARKYELEHGSLFTSEEAAKVKSTNIMERWITSLAHSYIKSVRKEMEAYRLYNVVPKLTWFIDQLCNWYVRLHRLAMKGEDGKEAWYNSLAVLFNVLYIIVRTMAPFTPFITEMMYQNLKKLIPNAEDSVHYLMIPDFDPSLIDTEVEEAVRNMQQVVEAGRQLRDQKQGVRDGLSFKIPVSEYVVCHSDAKFLKNIKDLEYYAKYELNAKAINVTSDVKGYLKLSATTNNKLLGKKLGQKRQEVSAKVATLTHEAIADYLNTGNIEIAGVTLGPDELVVNRDFIGDKKTYESLSTGTALVLMNKVLTPEFVAEGYARELTSRVQQLRKRANITIEDKVDVFYLDLDTELLAVVASQQEFMNTSLRGMNYHVNQQLAPGRQVIAQSDETIKQQQGMNSKSFKLVLVQQE